MIKNKKLLMTIPLALFAICISLGQTNKIKKANLEFDKYDFIDAREIYLMVVKDGYHSAEIYKKLGDTYYYNGDYTNAAKWYDKLMQQYPNEIETDYYYRAALSLKSIENLAESNLLMEKYRAAGGKELITEEFITDTQYLKSLGLEPMKYVVEKVATNSKLSDFGPAYYKDKLVFSASSKDRKTFKTHNWNNLPYLDLFVADMDEKGNLSNVQELKGEVNTKYHEASAVFTNDGKTMYFTRNNFMDGSTGSDNKRTIRLKTYKATIDANGNWGNITELPFNDNEYSVSHPALSKDEKRLYFASDMPGTYGRSDLWYVDILENGTYGTPVNLGDSVNTRTRETFPFISENNNLYFSADRRGGHGGLDVYIAPLNEKGEVIQVSNFGPPVNTNQDDFGFIIKESKGFGFFTSNVRGGRGSVDDEIYRFSEVCVMNIKVRVTDIDTGEEITSANVSLMDNSYGLIEKATIDENSSFSFTTECNSKYIVKAEESGYYYSEKSFSTPNEGGVMELLIQLKLKDPCPPNDLGCRLSLQPIYFDYDKADIRQDAQIELSKILSALRLYPQLNIHIESHTDSRGNDLYNKKLSERRAQSTRVWLKSQGIEETRLTAKGYGESQLLNDCINEADCAEEAHQLNRRSMFLIKE